MPAAELDACAAAASEGLLVDGKAGKDAIYQTAPAPADANPGTPNPAPALTPQLELFPELDPVAAELVPSEVNALFRAARRFVLFAFCCTCAKLAAFAPSALCLPSSSCRFICPLVPLLPKPRDARKLFTRLERPLDVLLIWSAAFVSPACTPGDS